MVVNDASEWSLMLFHCIIVYNIILAFWFIFIFKFRIHHMGIICVERKLNRQLHAMLSLPLGLTVFLMRFQIKLKSVLICKSWLSCEFSDISG